MDKHWADLPILLAAAETGSLTAAAEHLGISQPTAGRRIRALEAHFGAPLLSREDGRLIPTTLGETVLQRVRRMADEADGIERARAGAGQALAGIVTLSCSEGIGDMWLPQVMRTFRRRHPDTRVEVIIDPRAVNLARREADIALRWMGPGNQNSLVGRKVLAAGFGLYAAPEYIQRRGRPQAVDDLQHHDGVMVSIGGAKPFWPKQLAAKTSTPQNITFACNSFSAHAQALIAGHGIGVLAHCTWRGCTKGGELQRLLPEINIEEDLWVVAHEDLRRNARIRAVYDYLVEALLRDREFFETGGAPQYLNQGEA